MSFVEDLTKLWNDIWDAGFKSKPGNVADRPGELSPPSDGPFSRSYDEIISIQQKGAKGFQTYDIDPNLLPRSEFYCSIPETYLNTLTGPELGLDSLGWNVESNHVPFWRTVVIQSYANFVKIEYLPSGVNDILTYRENLPNETAMPSFPNPNLPGVTSTLSPYTPVRHASERIILVQFDDPKSAPIIAKHGDVFKIPCNTIYLTFKVWSPKIRVTLGFNTEIVSTDDRALMMSPAYAPGHGLVNNAFLHSVPYCISDDEIGAAIQTTLASPTSTQDLIANALSSSGQNGVLVGWINSVLYNVKCVSSVVTSPICVYCKMNIYIATYPGLSKIRKLVSIPMTPTSMDTDAVRFPEFGQTVTREFREPIRFTLHSNECLIAEFTGFYNQVTTTHRFSIEGYTYGNISSNTTFTPFFPQYMLNAEPFPQDRNYWFCPAK